MHRRGDDNALRHLDFTVIDMIMMQLACILMYWATGHGGILYRDPNYRMFAACLFAGQVALGLFSDSHDGVLTRDKYADLYMLALYILELWICCGAFLLLAPVSVRLIDALLVTVFFAVLAYFARMFNKYLHRRFSRRRRKVLVITSSELVRRSVAKINDSKKDTEHEVVGVCVTNDVDLARFSDLNIPVYSMKDPDLLDKLVTMWIDDVFFLAGLRPVNVSTFMEDFITMGITVHYSLSTLNDFVSVNTGVQSLGDYKVITNSAKLISYRAEFIKRSMDILGGLVGVMITGLLFLFVAPAIYIKSPGPIFFKQRRIGQNGQIMLDIQIILRTMMVVLKRDGAS